MCIRDRSQPVELKGEVGGTLKLDGPDGPLTLEFDDFRLFNLLPEPDAKPGDRKFRNFGPSVGFKVRNAAGEAWEYFNYMVPAQLEGRWFYISGMRARPGDPFTYLHIPMDANNLSLIHIFQGRLHRAVSGGTADHRFERRGGIPAAGRGGVVR